MAAEDWFDGMFTEVLGEIIKKEQENGTSDEMILKILQEKPLAQLYSRTADGASDAFLESMEEIMYEKVFENRALDGEFMAKQEQKWGRVFVAAEAMYLYVLESVESYVEFLNENFGSEISFIYHALRNIHARSMQVFLEILTLNKNGFADGAYARWRSLYELSITASFIKKYGEDVAKAFLESANTNDRYEWARKAECLRESKKRYITFSDIQKNSGLETTEWKREYVFVNQLVHASPQGTMFRLGERTGKVTPVGKTDWGMSISTIHAAISLSQITVDFFTIFHHGDSLIAAMTLHKWVEKISEYCDEVERNCFSDDDYFEYI